MRAKTNYLFFYTANNVLLTPLLFTILLFSFLNFLFPFFPPHNKPNRTNRTLLLSDLVLRPKQNLVWGFFHCEAEITWLDEAFMIFSEDIIQKFLAQNESSMLCHPRADQQVMLWLSNILHKTYFHDTRLHHQPPASFVARFSSISNV